MRKQLFYRCLLWLAIWAGNIGIRAGSRQFVGGVPYEEPLSFRLLGVS